jgi:hypothetical protein
MIYVGGLHCFGCGATLRPSTAATATTGLPQALTKNATPILRSASICFDLTLRPVSSHKSLHDKNVLKISPP